MSAVSSLLSGNSSSSGNSTLTSTNSLNSNDFIQMMITELQNQDPLDPTSSDQLLSEMSQIGQLQASDSTQSAMQNLSLQTQIGSSAALIGKSITGLDSNNNSVTGVVNSVQVASGAVNLSLDDGSTIALSNVTNIGGNSTSSTTGNSTSGASTSGNSTSAATAAAEAAAAAAAANAANTGGSVDASSQYSNGSSSYTGM